MDPPWELSRHATGQDAPGCETGFGAEPPPALRAGRFAPRVGRWPRVGRRWREYPTERPTGVAGKTAASAAAATGGEPAEVTNRTGPCRDGQEGVMRTSRAAEAILAEPGSLFDGREDGRDSAAYPPVLHTGV